MKKFRVAFSITNDFEVEVEAKDADHAGDIVQENAGNGDYDSAPLAYDMKVAIYEIGEATDEKGGDER